MLRIAIAIPAGAEGQPTSTKSAGGPGFSVALRSLSGAPSAKPGTISAPGTPPSGPAERQGLAGSGSVVPEVPGGTVTGKPDDGSAPIDDPERQDRAPVAQIAFAWQQPLPATPASAQATSDAGDRAGSGPTVVSSSALAVESARPGSLASAAQLDTDVKPGADPEDAGNAAASALRQNNGYATRNNATAIVTRPRPLPDEARQSAATPATDKRVAGAGAKIPDRPEGATVSASALKMTQALRNGTRPPDTETGDVGQQRLAATRSADFVRRASPTATTDPATAQALGKADDAIRAVISGPATANADRKHNATQRSPAAPPVPSPLGSQQHRQTTSGPIRQSPSPTLAGQPAAAPLAQPSVAATQSPPPQPLAAALSHSTERPVTRIAPSKGGGDDTGLTAILSVHGGASGQASAPATATQAQSQQPLDLRQDAGLDKMIDHIETLRSGDTDRSRIRLTPDALGSVDVSVRRDGDRVHIQFTTATAAAHSALADAAPRLAQLADARGVRLGQTGIDGGAADHGQPGQHGSHDRPSQPLRNIRAAASESADNRDDHADRIA